LFAFFFSGVLALLYGLIPFLSQRTAPQDRNMLRRFKAHLLLKGFGCLMVADAKGATTAGAVGATTTGAVRAATTAAFGVFYWLDVTDFGFILFFISFCFVLHITF
jgi:hypothetical protein